MRAKTKLGLRAGAACARAGHGGGAEAWAQGIRMARKSREGRNDAPPQRSFRWFSFSRCTRRASLLHATRFFCFSSLLSLIPLLHQIFTELVSPLILWTFGTALTGKRTNLAALPAAMHLGRKFGSTTTHCSQQSTGYRASRRKLFQLPEGDR